MPDWRQPFKELKNRLLHIYETCPSLYHAVALSERCDVESLKEPLDNLEPVLLDNPLVQEIRVETIGCRYHAHRFFGSNRSSLNALQRALIGIEDWCNKIPGGMLPVFSIPKTYSQDNANLIRWMSMVYYLAWNSNSPYLDITIEYLMHADGGICFMPWHDCPHPGGWKPLEWLIHQSSSEGVIPKWKQRFEERGYRLPDLLDGYMNDEVIRSSIAAVDILIAVLPLERRQPKDPSEDLAGWKKQTGQRFRKSLDKALTVAAELRVYHDPNESWYGRSGNVEKRDMYQALNFTSIAQIVDWKYENGGPNFSAAQRAMELIFGKNPASRYKQLVRVADRNRKLIEFLKQYQEDTLNEITQQNFPSDKLPSVPGTVGYEEGQFGEYDELNIHFDEDE